MNNKREGISTLGLIAVVLAVASILSLMAGAMNGERLSSQSQIILDGKYLISDVMDVNSPADGVNQGQCTVFGDTIVFTRQADNGSEQYSINTYNITSGEESVLIDCFDYGYVKPILQLTENWLAFAGTPTADELNGTAVWLYDRETEDVTNISWGAGDISDMSMDRNVLAWCQGDGGSLRDVWSYDTTTETVVQVTTGDFNEEWMVAVKGRNIVWGEDNGQTGCEQITTYSMTTQIQIPTVIGEPPNRLSMNGGTGFGDEQELSMSDDFIMFTGIFEDLEGIILVERDNPANITQASHGSHAVATPIIRGNLATWREAVDPEFDQYWLVLYDVSQGISYRILEESNEIGQRYGFDGTTVAFPVSEPTEPDKHDIQAFQIIAYQEPTTITEGGQAESPLLLYLGGALGVAAIIVGAVAYARRPKYREL